MAIRWNEPRFGEEELQEVSKVIKESYVNEGPKTKELEELFRNYLGVKHVIFTTNATAALFLSLKADSIIKNKNDFEVIIPDMTMIATATSVEWAGGKPVLVDIEKTRGTIDVGKIEEKINHKTSVIVPVHILGRAADMNRIMEIAQRNNLTVIEDAAGALGSKYMGKFLGTIGKVGCYSLQSNKIITCGQGGVIVTNDDLYYETIRRLRDFGRASNKEFVHEKIGYNLKFNDLSASLALAQFRKIEERKKLLREQYNQYREELKDLKEINFFSFNEDEIPLWIDVVVENREKIVEDLKSHDIHPREIWPAIHKNPPFMHHGTNRDFPNAHYFSDNCLWLPNGPVVSREQISFICEKIKEFIIKSRKEFKKIHEDKRGYIYLVKNLLEDNKEFTFLEVKKGFARGGCLHSKDEYFVVVKGKIKYIHADKEEEVFQGESRLIRAGEPHAFIGLEDSIVSEWGITTEEKEMDKKDPKLREIIDKANMRE